MRWEHAIVEWQQPVLEDSSLPSWYRALLFNELYFMTDGGCVWTCTTEGNEWLGGENLAIVGRDGGEVIVYEALAMQLNKRLQGGLGEQDTVGQFLYLEGHEYLMYNTYDVHFYASFALLQLWPQLELSLQRDFARAVFMEDRRVRVTLGDGSTHPRKILARVPHDLGSPSEHPWASINAYNFQDVSKWKDLGPKFILQVLRDFVFVSATNTSSGAFLADMYPACKAVMEGCLAFDVDGDGMIENEGVPDQTYDIWCVRGVSAYTGGLWCAACSAMVQMAQTMGDDDTAYRFAELSARAHRVYESALWNGRYFLYDNSAGRASDSVMADQLAGHWYARACGLHPIASPAQALSTLRTIFELNVRTFGRGELLGAGVDVLCCIRVEHVTDCLQ
jgi:non-lysosomal glucosylceramidase